jgi:hypothetical protein
VTRRSTGIECQLSDVPWEEGSKVLAGTPSYIIQKEFHRLVLHY